MDNKHIIQLGVGAVVFNDDTILLVKRKNPPNQHQWAIPGGKVKYGEALKEAVKREILEETGIVIHVQEPIYTFEVIKTNDINETSLHYVVIDFTAEYISGTPSANDDAEQTSWVSRAEYSSLDINSITQQLLRDKFDFP